jgi:hypothetical protein
MQLVCSTNPTEIVYGQDIQRTNMTSYAFQYQISTQMPNYTYGRKLQEFLKSLFVIYTMCNWVNGSDQLG